MNWHVRNADVDRDAEQEYPRLASNEKKKRKSSKGRKKDRKDGDRKCDILRTFGCPCLL